MRISPLTEQAINEVIENLSEVSRKEAEIFGKNMDDLRKKFINMIGAPFSGAFYKDHGTCQALFGLETIGNCRWRTHFISAREGFKKIGFALTRFFAKFSDRLVLENEGKGYIEIISAYNNGKVDEWFRAMGFYLTETDGVANKYVKQLEGGD